MTSNLRKTMRPKLRSDLNIDKLGDEHIILDADGGKVHAVNNTAYSVLQYCDGFTSIDSIITQMSESFPDVPSEALSSDVVRIIEEFYSNALFSDNF